MADQVFTVQSGFFDAVNEDRTYYAADMNRPYKRIVANGVFAQQNGNPSSDFQVTAAGGMTIQVAAGEGLFGDRWFTNPAAFTITVPDNTNIVPRIDSVIAQVDTRQSGRCGNIVYRTGTPASTPAAPAINQTADVYEYRIANIRVEASATTITSSKITDRRGSSECPWVTSLIQQVDTSTLFEQFKAAYEEYFEQQSAEFDAWTAQEKANWDEFFSSLSQDLTVTMNIMTLTNTYTTTTTEDEIPIGIASYDSAHDVLMVFVNGLMLASGRYTATNSTVTLQNALSAGQKVNFVVFKSVIADADAQTITALVQDLENDIAALNTDSGWQTLTLQNGSAGDVTPAYRKFGNVVYLRGTVTGISAVGTVLAELPSGYRPTAMHFFTAAAFNGTTARAVAMKLENYGELSAVASSSSITSSYQIPIDTCYIVG